MKTLLARFTLISMVFTLFFTVFAASAQDENPLEETRWQLVSFGDETAILPESLVTLEFDAEDALSGSSGCNSYGGSYVIDGESIEISDVFSTRMACMEDGLMDQENAYLEALQSATSYSITDDELILNYEGGQLIFSAVSELVDTRWTLVSFGEIDDPTVVLPESAITLEFDAENTASGSGGCNEYNGIYRLEDDNIVFEDIISTLRACVDNAITEQEQVYLDALNTATSYEIQESQLLINYGENGQLVFDEVSPLVDTQWQLTTFGIIGEETAIVPESEVTLEFTSTDEVGGSAGCNSYGGSYTSDEDTITFSPLFRTEMACMEDGLMDQENAYLQALESATAYEIFEGQLTIMYGENAHLIFSEIIPADS